MLSPLFFYMHPKEQTTLAEFNKNKNKLCILRSYGGLGDIIAMRMIFQDLKLQYPEFHITWAVPYIYFPVAKNHPYIDDVVCSHTYKRKDYICVYNLSTICTRYEWKHKNQNLKNRSDIWANYFGLNLENHNTFMTSFPECKNIIQQKLLKLGWDGIKKIVLLSPISAIPVKNLLKNQIEHIKKMTEQYFLVILHTNPILEFADLNIPTVCGLTLDQAMCAVEMCDFCISTDTGILHAAAAYKKPTLGIFSFVDGQTYCKYYPTVEIVQKHQKDFPGWCGPCHDFARCPKNLESQIKPCITDIDKNMIEEKWSILLNKYGK